VDPSGWPRSMRGGDRKTWQAGGGVTDRSGTNTRKTEGMAASAHHFYDAYWRTEGWATHPPRELLALLARHVSANDRCLDVGCGDGGTSGVWLHEYAAGYVGVDISPSAVRMAADRGLDAQLIDDAAELPFDDASFDVAVCIEVIEHLFEPQRALSEIVRVLRPGGRLIVTVPNAAHWRNRLDLALLGRWNPRGDHLSPSQPWRDPHIRFFSLGSLVSLMQRCGFAVLEHGGYAQYAVPLHVPGLRKLIRTPQARPFTRRQAARFPRVLAETIYVVGQAGTRSA
jgi:methionine biosynthesis protein MetW